MTIKYILALTILAFTTQFTLAQTYSTPTGKAKPIVHGKLKAQKPLKNIDTSMLPPPFPGTWVGLEHGKPTKIVPLFSKIIIRQSKKDTRQFNITFIDNVILNPEKSGQSSPRKWTSTAYLTRNKKLGYTLNVQKTRTYKDLAQPTKHSYYIFKESILLAYKNKKLIPYIKHISVTHVINGRHIDVTDHYDYAWLQKMTRH